MGFSPLSRVGGAGSYAGFKGVSSRSQWQDFAVEPGWTNERLRFRLLGSELLQFEGSASQTTGYIQYAPRRFTGWISTGLSTERGGADPDRDRRSERHSDLRSKWRDCDLSLCGDA